MNGLRRARTVTHGLRVQIIWSRSRQKNIPMRLCCESIGRRRSRCHLIKAFLAAYQVSNPLSPHTRRKSCSGRFGRRASRSATRALYFSWVPFCDANTRQSLVSAPGRLMVAILTHRLILGLLVDWNSMYSPMLCLGLVESFSKKPSLLTEIQLVLLGEKVW